MRRLSGTITLLRFALRRDRIVVPAWAALFLAYTVGGTAAAIALYPDQQARVDAASAVNDMPAILVMYGRIWDPTGLGSVAMMKPIGFGGIFAAVFAVLLVTRHTRTEEESGRVELIRAQAVGALAPLTAALLEVALVMTALCLVNGVGVTASGLPAASAWAFAVSVSLTGMCFAGIAAVAVQLTESARTANVFAFVSLATAWLLRGTADVRGDMHASAWWTWLSPVGWQSQVRAFAGDRWAVLPLFVLATTTCGAFAAMLARNRDLGAGVIPQRSGRATAGRWLRTPFALAGRLQRGLLIGLGVSYALLGLLLGAVLSDAGKFMESPSMRQYLLRMAGTNELSLAFVQFEVGMVGLITALCAVILMRRLTTEDQAGRLEPVLATAVAPQRLLAAHFAVVALAVTGLQLLLGFGLWAGNGMQTGTFSGFTDTMAACLVQLPAIWLVQAITVLAFAVAPTLANVGWLVIGGLVVINEFGPMFRWPAAIMNLSPFTHLPRLPGGAMHWTPVLLLIGLAIAGFTLSRTTYARRDLTAS